jgi:selenocysteine-specific elongation factor
MEPELAVEEAQEHLAGTPLAGLTPVCVSAATGEGMAELRAELAALVARMPVPNPDADVRMWVDRSFTIRGAGTVLTGTLPAGRLRVDDELVLEPGGRRVRVRGLHSMDAPITEATGVARVAVNLRGVPKESVGRGDVLVSPDSWLTTNVIDVRLNPVRGEAPPGRLPEQLSLHIGAAAVPVRVRPLGSEVTRLTLAGPLPLRIGDRALLRDPGARRIVAGLTVLDVRPPALTRRGAAAHRAAELAASTGAPDPTAELARRGLVSAAELAAMGADPAALDQDVALGAGEWLLHRERAGELAARLVAVVTEHDAADPVDPGLPIGAARRALGLPDNRLVEAVVASVGRNGALAVREGRVYHVEAAALGLAPRLRKAIDVLREELPNPFTAPEANRLAELGLGPKELAALVKAKELDRLAPGVYVLPGVERRAVAALAELGEPEFTASTARQVLGTSRRVIVPLLERLARDGHTTRTEDGGHRLLR